MILTDTSIKKIISNSKLGAIPETLIINPYLEDSITPVGYDLRIGNHYFTKLSGGPHQLEEGEIIKLAPGDILSVNTLENIKMPTNRSLSALIMSKVSKVSKGLSHISTTIDPDWSGNLLITLTNFSNVTIELKYGEAFCTIVFIRNELESTKLCEKGTNRLDILMKEWAENYKKIYKKNKVYKTLISLGLPIICFILGLIFWGENVPGLVALTALGFGVAQSLISNFFTK